MKFRMIICGFVLGAGAALVGGQALSQQQGGQMPSPQEMQEMMEKMMKVMRPGEHHRKMQPMVGTWDSTMRIWMQGPDAPPTEIAGVTTREGAWQSFPA